MISNNIKTLIRSYNRHDNKYSTQLHLYLFSLTSSTTQSFYSWMSNPKKNNIKDIEILYDILNFVRYDDETIKNVSIKDRSILENIILNCMRDVITNIHSIYAV